MPQQKAANKKQIDTNELLGQVLKTKNKILIVAAFHVFAPFVH
jgi:LPS O-antigen subunit length determinant protein (WzzB/FepE family)